MALQYRTGPPGHCPDCGETPVNVQGLVDCPACEWRSRGDGP